MDEFNEIFVQFFAVFGTLLFFIACIYLFYLVTKALKKYTVSQQIRKKRQRSQKTLGEVLKNHRIECKMTQEFVGRSNRCKQTGSIKMGKRKIRPKYDQSTRFSRFIWY